MKWPAVLVLATLLLTAAIQPLGELANILKEKVVLNAALMNSCRAAHNNALNIWYMMNLEAYVNEDDFIELFSDAFSESLDLSLSTKTDNRLTFASNSGRFNDITVEFEMERTTYDEYSGATTNHNRPITVVTATMKTPYLFRTYWLRTVNGVSNSAYLLTDSREYIVQIIN